MYFNGNYLRVRTPRTTNGVIQKTVNGVVQYKETLLPLSAKKQIDKKNARLTKNGFGHLVSIVEEVGAEQPKQLVKEPVVKKAKK